MPRKTRRRQTIDPTKMLWIGIMVLGLLTTLGIGVLLVTRLRRALVARAEGDAADPLRDFRLAYERGEMDQAEFLRIKSSLAREARAFSTAPPGRPRGDEPTS